MKKDQAASGGVSPSNTSAPRRSARRRARTTQLAGVGEDLALPSALARDRRGAQIRPYAGGAGFLLEVPERLAAHLIPEHGEQLVGLERGEARDALRCQCPSRGFQSLSPPELPASSGASRSPLAGLSRISKEFEEELFAPGGELHFSGGGTLIRMGAKDIQRHPADERQVLRYMVLAASGVIFMSYAGKLVTGLGKEGGVSVTVRADHASIEGLILHGRD